MKNVGGKAGGERKIRRRWGAWTAVAVVLCVVVIWGARRLVVGAAEGLTFDAVADVPAHEAALVLGCSKRLPDGRSNLFFRNRVDAAAALYRAGKVKYLIVSGDNHAADYDEPSDMKRALVAHGVPPSSVYCDYAGFRTLDSVVRAKAIFGQDHFIVVSQKFHNQRAIFLARHKGLDAIGFNACDVAARHAVRTWVREQLARVKTVMDLYLFRSEPRFYGPPVVLGS